MSRIGTASNFQGAIGASAQYMHKNQHEVVNQHKQQHELKRELDKEKETTFYYQKLLEKALEEIKLYVERYGTFAQKDEDELEKLYQQVENQNLKRDLDFKKLEPLLQSYEETIAELKHLVQMYTKEVGSLELRATKYVEENLSLRNELEKKCQMILNIYQSGSPVDQMANLYKKIQKDDISDKIMTLSEENHNLIASFKELQGKFKEKERDCTVAEKQFNEEKNKCIQLMKELDTLQTQFNDMNLKQSQLISDQTLTIKKSSAFQTKSSQLESTNMKLEKELKLWKDKAQQIQKDLEEIEFKLQKQLSSNQVDLRKKDSMIKDNEGQIIRLTKENEILLDENKQIKNKLYTKEQEYDRQIIKGEEQDRKLKQYVVKDEKHIKTASDLNEKLQNATLERDEFQIKAQQLERNLNNQEEQHKKQLESVRVEKEKLIDQLRTKQKNLIDERDASIEDLQYQNEDMRIQIEKLQKDNHKLKQEKDEMNRLIKTDKYKLENENEYMKKKVIELEDQAQRREQYHEDRMSALKLDKEQLELQNTNLQQLQNELKHQNEALRKKSNVVEVQNYELKEKVTTMSRSQMQGSNSKALRSQIGNNY